MQHPAGGSGPQRHAAPRRGVGSACPRRGHMQMSACGSRDVGGGVAIPRGGSSCTPGYRHAGSASGCRGGPGARARHPPWIRHRVRTRSRPRWRDEVPSVIFPGARDRITGLIRAPQASRARWRAGVPGTPSALESLLDRRLPSDGRPGAHVGARAITAREAPVEQRLSPDSVPKDTGPPTRARYPRRPDPTGDPIRKHREKITLGTSSRRRDRERVRTRWRNQGGGVPARRDHRDSRPPQQPRGPHLVKGLSLTLRVVTPSHRYAHHVPTPPAQFA